VALEVEGQPSPLGAVEELHEIPLDLLGIGVRRPAETSRHPDHVRVDDDSLHLLEAMLEDGVRRLAGDAGEREELLHRGGHARAEAFDDGARGALNRLCLVAVEARWAHGRFERGQRLLREVLRRAVALEERGSDLVHLLVGALGGEDRRDEKLEGVLESQVVARVRVEALELGEHGARLLRS